VVFLSSKHDCEGSWGGVVFDKEVVRFASESATGVSTEVDHGVQDLIVKYLIINKEVNCIAAPFERFGWNKYDN
jgi:hypothetical protein